MKKKLILFIILFYSLISKAQTFEQSLNSDKVQWKFYCLTPSPLERAGVRLGQKFPATVPGTVHLDLLDNKLIPDPFYADNEKRLQWIDTLDWVYETTFDVDSNLFEQGNIELQFDGLDTYADVYLNDEKIITADNMFVKWNEKLKWGRRMQHKLKLKNNQLKIIFHSTLKEAKKIKEAFEKEHGYELPEGERVFVRKAQYQFGWDFAPKFLGCGIWKGVKIIGWDYIHVKQYSIAISKIFPIDSALIKIKFEGEYSLPKFEDSIFKYYCPRKFHSYLVVKHSDEVQKISFSRSPRINSIHDSLEFVIHKIKKWNCNSFDSVQLDSLNLSFEASFLFSETNRRIQTEEIGKVEIAIRKIEFIQQKDSIGESFYFKLNGKPVFIKGANWVPADVFLPRVSHEKYRNLLTVAKDAGINMLRVWGGGIYEDEYFYHLCDSLGIMVWQDLPFACSMYPSPLNFFDTIPIIDSISGEVLGYEAVERKIFYELKKQNISKPGFYCGNNEIDEGWKNWGWQEQYHYSKKDSTEIWNNYKELFEEFIPNTLKEMGCDIPYIPSSPKFGWGHKESLTDGDSHYWGVWWGMEPYEIYKKRVPRFASEYGMQSLPCLETIRKFAPDSSLRINSVAMRNHQKHPTGFENLDGYLKYYGFKVNGGLVKGRKVIPEYGKGNPDAMDSTNVVGGQTPTTASDLKGSPKLNANPTLKEFEDYINATQQLQADALRTAIEAHMKAQPRCMGTILWQLNEPWPGASWSLIDYYGNKKKAYYEVQKLFKEKK